MGLLPKPHDARPSELTALATAGQIGLIYVRLDHTALDQLLSAAQCWADWRTGDGFAVHTFPRVAKHVNDPAVHLEDLWLRRWGLGHGLRAFYRFQSASAQTVHVLRDEREGRLGRDFLADRLYGKLGESDMRCIRLCGEGSRGTCVGRLMGMRERDDGSADFSRL
jgi:hypothetical protein